MEIFIILSIPAVEVNERIDKMKFTPEVIAALNVLKSAAENDFELHRINTLEQDLTTPPKVEIVDDKHQKFDGVTYKQNKNGHFGRIHRAVYHYYFGDIPEGYEIHHIDENKANNDISNLVMLTKLEHRQLHIPKGQSFYKQKKIFICENCGKEYEAFDVGNNRFCSAECMYKVAYRERKTIIKTCPRCGKQFYTKKEKQIYCSRSCGGKNPKKCRRIKKICPICGKEFETRLSVNRPTCSRECGCKYREMNRQKKD